MPADDAALVLTGGDATLDVAALLEALPGELALTGGEVEFEIPEQFRIPSFGDYSEANPNAVAVTRPWSVDDHTGFHVKPNELKTQWDGLMTKRSKNYDHRHPQDFVKGRHERTKITRSPEGDDVFLESATEVSAEDL